MINFHHRVIRALLQAGYSMGAFFEIFLELGGVVGWQRFPLDMVRARVILTVLMARLFQQSVYVLREI